MSSTSKLAGTLFGAAACLSALATLPAISAYGSGTAVYREKNGVVVLDSLDQNPVGYVFAIAMVLAALSALVGVVLLQFGRLHVATGAFLVAGVSGLVTVVPGVLALLAFRAVRKQAGAAS